MSNSMTPSNSSPTAEGDFFERLADRQVNVAYVLFGLAAALAVIPIVNLSLYRWESLAVFLWGAALTLFVFGIGVWQLTTEVGGERRDRADRLRITFLLVLGGVGLLTALLGLLLPFSSSPFSITDYREIFAGGVRKWRERENAWALARCAAAMLGGLILMFLGLMQARTFERTSPNLRRLLYGYNAILTSVLLILIAGLINLLPYSGVQPFSYANEPVDWTRTGIHSLHPATKNVLAELKQPVMVYVLGTSGDRIAYEMIELLKKCMVYDPQLNWEQISRDRNRTALVELMQKYQVPESEGVLVVYGTEPNTVHDFIKTNDLFEQKMSEEPGRRFVFKGENALLNTLTFLSSGKKKAVVYFTQGNGELGFNERQANQIDIGLGLLIDELNRINFESKELTVTADTDKIPDDADIVVIARPRDEYPAKFVSGLRDYVKGTNRKENKKGKLFVLFDVIQRGGKGPMVHTGLEALMTEHGVRVGDNRVLSPLSRDEPLTFTAIANPRSKNPIARSFAGEEGLTPFDLYKARTVEPAQSNAPGAPAADTVETLLMTVPIQRFLVDTDLDASPRGVIEELNKLARADLQKARERLSQAPVSLAVTVSEGQAPPPIPGHDFMARDGKPLMVVFGDASWVSNGLLQRSAPFHFNLFSSCLSWLAERADIGTRVPPTQHDVYRIQAAPGSSLRIVVLPGVLMALGVLGLGLGVWVVRRR